MQNLPILKSDERLERRRGLMAGTTLPEPRCPQEPATQCTPDSERDNCLLTEALKHYSPGSFAVIFKMIVMMACHVHQNIMWNNSLFCFNIDARQRGGILRKTHCVSSIDRYRCEVYIYVFMCIWIHSLVFNSNHDTYDFCIFIMLLYLQLIPHISYHFLSEVLKTKRS